MNIPATQKYQIVERFYGAGILVKDGVEEPKQSNYIKSLYLVVTKRCNLSCNFCAMESNSTTPFEQLKIEELKSIVNKFKGYKIGNLIITGGEPFFRKDIFEIIDYIHEHINTKVTVCTNGLLLNQEKINRIKGKVRRIDMSVENLLVDGNKKDIEKMIKVFDILKQNKIKFSLSYVLTKENQNRVFQFLNLAHQYDTLFSLKTVKPMGNAKGNEDLFFTGKEVSAIYYKIFEYIYSQKFQSEPFQRFLIQPLIPAYSCSAKGKMLSVYTDGSVYSCHSLSYPEFSTGNVLQEEVPSLMKTSSIMVRSSLYHKSFDINERNGCRNCEIRYFCQGYCFAELYDNQDSIHSLPPECGIKKAIISFNLWQYNAESSFLDNLELFLKNYDALSDNKIVLTL